MKFKCYQHWSQLPQQVDLLFKYGEQTSMFTTREWFETLYNNAFDNNKTLLLACVVETDHVLVLLPLQGVDGHWQALRHRYTSLFTLLTSNTQQHVLLNCLAQGLNQLNIHSLDLSPVARHDHTLNQLKQALETQGFSCHQRFLFYNWIHRTNGQSYQEYLAERPSTLRNTLKRKQRKLQREQNFNIKMYQGIAVKQGLNDYHTTYFSSWKAHEQYTELLNAIANNLAIPNWTRLAVLSINEQPAAAQLWFVVQRKASIFRLAYAEQWKHYSPGSLLTAYLMRHVIDIDKVSEIDFLTGNEPYKQDWMSQRQKRYSMMFGKAQTKHNKVMTVLQKISSTLFKHS